MTKRHLLLVLALFLLPFATTNAQSAPAQLDAALIDLGVRVGETVTISDLQSFTWQQQVYEDFALGCPVPEGTEVQEGTVSAFQFDIVYQGDNYDYRVSGDSTIVILCTTDAELAPEATAIPTLPFVAGPGLEDPFDPPAPECEGAMTPILRVGNFGRVTPGLPNNVREQPGLSGTFVGEIPAGGVFGVLEGPVCGAGLYWYRVDFEGLQGWTAMGSEGSYFLENVPRPLPTSRTVLDAFNVSRMGQVSSIRGNVSGEVDWAADGNRVATIGVSDFPGAFVYDTGNLAVPPQYIELDVENVSVGSIALSPDATVLAIGSSAGVLRFYTLATGVERLSYTAADDPLQDIEFNPASNPQSPAIAAGSGALDGAISPTGEKLQYRDAFTSSELARFGFSETPVLDVAFSPSGALLASSGLESVVRLWDTATGTASLGLQGHTGAVNAVAFSADGAIVASAGSDATVRLWDAASGALLATIPNPSGQEFHTVAFSPNGQLLATAGSTLLSPETDPVVRVWDIRDVSTGVPLLVELEGHDGFISDVAFSPDGTLLASVSDDRSLRIWGLGE